MNTQQNSSGLTPRQEAELIFDSFGKAARMINIKHQIDEKRAQLRNVCSRRCGNCDKWMTSACTPEKVQKQFKHMNSYGCRLFSLNAGSERLMGQFSKEIVGLETKLTNFMVTGE